MEVAGGGFNDAGGAEHVAQPFEVPLLQPAEGFPDHAADDLGHVPLAVAGETPIVGEVVAEQPEILAARPPQPTRISGRSMRRARVEAIEIDSLRDRVIDLLREGEGTFHMRRMIWEHTHQHSLEPRQYTGLVQKLGVIADMGLIKRTQKGRYIGEVPPDPEPPVTAPPKEVTKHVVEAKPEARRPGNIDEMIASADLYRSAPRKSGSEIRQRYSHKPRKDKRR